MDSVLRAAVLLILTYATGLILQGVVLLPFALLTFGFAVLARRILLKAAQSRSKTLIHASTWPSFRKAATVVLGEAMVPQAPNMSADPLSEPVQVQVPNGAKLKSEAPKTSLFDFDRQWRDIHLTIRRLQLEKDDGAAYPGESPFTSLILSIAAPIVVERWLSFGVPSVLYWAAILGCVSGGLMSIPTSFMLITDPYAVQAFLFDHVLARSAGTKTPSSSPSSPG